MRRLLELTPQSITLEQLRFALHSAGDEDERFEIKGPRARPEQLIKSVGGLANRDGGILVVGAERDAGSSWRLAGRVTSVDEFGHWLGQIIGEHLKPVPGHTIRVFDDAGTSCAVVFVDAHADHLVATSDGKIFRREHGRTLPVDDGRRLTELVQARTGPGTPSAVDIESDPDRIAEAFVAAAQRGHIPAIRAPLTALRARIVYTAQFESDGELAAACDRLAALTAALAQSSPDDAMTAFAIDSLQNTVDEASEFIRIPGGRPDLDLFRAVRLRARALGGMFVRLGLWPLIRELVDHRPATADAIYPGWLTYIAAQEARVSQSSAGGDLWRSVIRESVAVAMSYEALRPDYAGEEQVLDSVLAFDMLAALIELDIVDRSGLRDEVGTAFALFGGKPAQRMGRRVLDEPAVLGALLPERRVREAVSLLTRLDDVAKASVRSVGFWDGLFDRTTAQRVAHMA